MALSKTTRLNLAKHATGDQDWGDPQNTGMDDADARFFQEDAGTPVGVKTPDYVSQRYFDTTSERWWTANGVGINDWKIDADIQVAGGTINGAVTISSGILTMTAGGVQLSNLFSLLALDTGAVARNLINLDGSDRIQVGAIAPIAGIDFKAFGADEFTVEYTGGGGQKKIWHEGNSSGFMPRTPDATGNINADLDTNFGSSAHGLSDPALSEFWLECVINDGNFVIGDKIAIGSTPNFSTLLGFSAWYNEDDVGYAMDDRQTAPSDARLAIADKGTETAMEITNANWQFNWALWNRT